MPCGLVGSNYGDQGYRYSEYDPKFNGLICSTPTTPSSDTKVKTK
jgi:hypothetical protein